jgi:hypothetical protein
MNALRRAAAEETEGFVGGDLMPGVGDQDCAAPALTSRVALSTSMRPLPSSEVSAKSVG